MRFHNWQEVDDGVELRSILGRRVARIARAGDRWRITVWRQAGTSSRTAFDMDDACEIAEELARE